jgi:transposase
LRLGLAAEVEQAHREFETKRNELQITEVKGLQSNNGKTSFIFSDLDKNWWELTAKA